MDIKPKLTDTQWEWINELLADEPKYTDEGRRQIAKSVFGDENLTEKEMGELLQSRPAVYFDEPA